MNNKQYLDLSYIIDIDNFSKSLQKWLSIRKQYEEDSSFNFKQLFNKYLPIVKPIMHRFVQITDKLSSQQYGFYSCLQEDQILGLKKLFPPLQPFQVIKENEGIRKVSNLQEIQKLLEQKYPQIYRINLKEQPKNDEYGFWNKFLQVPQIQIKSQVAKGKGEGAKNLGMPTANLNLSVHEQQLLSSYPNGIYLVDFEFEGGEKYFGAGCLGTNPHYQNLKNSRRVEVYVLNEFDEEFYGQKVRVRLKRLIRFEGKFHSFDAFLNAMHNDIFVIGNMCFKK